MKNRDIWKPSKYVRYRGRLRASRDRQEVGVGSRLIADLVARAFDERIPRHCRGRLLDLGCGQAPLFGTYAPYVDEVTCVDWGGSEHGTQHVDCEADLTHVLPLADSAYDTIILSDVLEHLPNPHVLWQEMGRILRPEGKILITVPFYYWIHEEPHDYYRYTAFALRRFAQEAGLAVVELVPLGGAPEILLDLVAKHTAVLPLIGSAVSSILQGVGGALCRVPPVSTISSKYAPRFPLEYFMIVQR